MDALTSFLDLVREKQLARGNFRGFLHVLVGRRISAPGGTVVSTGMTFRDVASLLKKVRWDPNDVKELGIDPETLPLRDRQRYWFSAICHAQLDTATAITSGDTFAPLLRREGYEVGNAPGQTRTA